MDAELAKKVQEYKKAVESEYREERDPSELAKNARKDFVQLLPKVAEVVGHLLFHAEKETTQLNAAKFVWTVCASEYDGAEDPLKKLFEELKLNDPT